MNKKLKIVIFIVLAIIAVIVAMKVFGGGSSATPATTSPLSSSAAIPGSSAKTGATPAQSNEFSTLLSSVKSIDIDTSIFDNPAYKNLRDYPVSLGTDVVGRQNPFAPIGVDPVGGTGVSAGAGMTSAPELQTLQPGKITANGAEFGAQMTVTDTVPVQVIFEYGISDTFGSATAPVVLGKNGTVLSSVTELAPATLYYVRAVAAQGSNTTTGTTMTFTTLAKAAATPKKR